MNTTRLRCVRTAVGAALAASVVAVPSARAADAPSTRLYLHSRSGTYAEDARGTVPFSAPAGSVLSTDLPARATSAKAGGGGSTPFIPGGPTTPTWANPLAGRVTNVCVDLFIEATPLTPTVPPGTEQKIHVRNHVGGATGKTFVHAFSSENHPAGVVRITRLVSTEEPYELDGKALFSLSGLATGTATVQRGNPDWTLHYDSPEHFSSVTFNSTQDKCTPERLPGPKK